MRLIYITSLFLFCSFSAFSQFGIKGRLIDSQEKTGVIGAAVRLTSTKDTTKTLGVFTDIEGAFQIKNIENGIYSLQITYIGYQTIRRNLSIQKDENLGDIVFQAENKLLKEVIVQGKQVRAEQKGDTVQYNADAYKVNKDASAEELITKIPGITTQNGRVEAQGEAVRRVTVDGQEYFGDDAAAALKNLPAEIISKVEVFDRLSDQAQFSGVNDGNTEKAINIVTKSGKNNGQFGKFYGGFGTDDRFAAGGNVNYFKKTRRISVIGLSNNVNIQNFANEDILEAMGGGTQNGQRFRGGGNGGNNDFFVAPSNGITRTHALGINYSDVIGKKLKYSTSIFLNDTKNTIETTLSRLLLLPNQTNQLYEQLSNQVGQNANTRINARIEYSPNRNNQFIITPRISLQSNATSTELVGKNSLQSIFLSQLSSQQAIESNGNSVNGSILYNHRFAKAGRTVSLNTTLSNSLNQSNALLLSENLFANSTNNQNIDQETRSDINRNGLTTRLEYNEPLSKQSQLQLGYEKSWSTTDSDRKTFDKELSENLYNRLNIPLSNEFMSDYNLDKGSISYRYNKGRTFNANASLAVQKATLTGDQTFPFAFDVNREFFNVLPNAFVRYAISPQKNIRFFYRTSANAPSITQLQRVINNTNPLQLRTGNPELDQEFGHNGSVRYSSSNLKKGTNFYANIGSQITMNNITNTTFIAQKDTTINGVLLNKGTQLTLPINYGKGWRMNSFVTYGFPLTVIKSNLNVNGGISYTNTPGLTNGQENIAENMSINGGLVLSSNINENIDFSLSYRMAYSFINNSLRPELNSNFYTQNASAKFNWISKKGAVVQWEGANTSIRGLGAGFDQNFTLVNASIGQKLGKRQASELKITVFDLFNQNQAISRILTESSVEDSRSLVLQQYFLLTYTYFLRKFK